MNRFQKLEQKVFEQDIRLTTIESKSNHVLTPQKIDAIISDGTKYQTNFVKTRYGNGIKTGTELLVRIRGAETVTGKLSYKGQLLMIDQSHSRDEDNDGETINFKLKHRRFRLFNYNLPLGTYELHLWFWNKATGERGLYRDRFQIVA